MTLNAICRILVRFLLYIHTHSLSLSVSLYSVCMEKYYASHVYYLGVNYVPHCVRVKNIYNRARERKKFCFSLVFPMQHLSASFPLSCVPCHLVFITPNMLFVLIQNHWGSIYIYNLQLKFTICSRTMIFMLF